MGDLIRSHAVLGQEAFELAAGVEGQLIEEHGDIYRHEHHSYQRKTLCGDIVLERQHLTFSLDAAVLPEQIRLRHLAFAVNVRWTPGASGELPPGLAMTSIPSPRITIILPEELEDFADTISNGDLT